MCLCWLLCNGSLIIGLVCTCRGVPEQPRLHATHLPAVLRLLQGARGHQPAMHRLVQGATKAVNLMFFLALLTHSHNSPTHSHSLLHSLSHTRTRTPSLTHSFTHSLTHSLTHTHSHSITHLVIVSPNDEIKRRITPENQLEASIFHERALQRWQAKTKTQWTK